MVCMMVMMFCSPCVAGGCVGVLFVVVVVASSLGHVVFETAAAMIDVAAAPQRCFTVAWLHFSLHQPWRLK